MCRNRLCYGNVAVITFYEIDTGVTIRDCRYVLQNKENFFQKELEEMLEYSLGKPIPLHYRLMGDVRIL